MKPPRGLETHTQGLAAGFTPARAAECMRGQVGVRPPGQAVASIRDRAADDTQALEGACIRVLVVAYTPALAGGCHTGPGGGLYTGPGCGLYTGPGGGLYAGPCESPYRSKWPTRPVLIQELQARGMGDIAKLLREAWGL